MNPTNILDIEPKPLWRNFYSLTQIPRPSGKRDLITSFLKEFGTTLHLETMVDDAGNVIIKKPATKGLENKKTVILQAHMDMVPQKNSNIEHNFDTDPICTQVVDGWVKATNTTLGADNGIGLAAAMTLLESTDIAHPALEVLITADEETGMHGAFGLQPNLLKGEILMNLDSEDEGELYVGCAGGLDADICFRYKEEPIPAGDVALKISLTGLKGGHSGVDIHLQRANANKLMFRFLKEAVKEYEARLASINGGSLRNAIPREAFAVITIPEDSMDDMIEFVSYCNELFQEEYQHTENNIRIDIEQIELPNGLMPEQIQDDLINSITACPNGVFRFLDKMPSVVETSNNLAIINSNGESIVIRCLIRSSFESRKDELASMIESIFSMAGAKVDLIGGYPGWSPNLDSEILKTMSSIYESTFGNSPKEMIIHAGLECGIIGKNYPKLDMISFGPTIRYPHSPDEKVEITSVSKFWELLVEILKHIPLASH